MSTNKRWRLLSNRDMHGAETAALAHALGLLEPTAVLLYNRGHTTPELAGKFLRRDEIRFHDPFLLDDMQKACIRIERALAGGERIVIYGDYDVDGVTAVSTLLLYLRSRGADAGYYIPNRTGEGYGINSAALEQLAGEGCTLLVTVDTGITAVDEIELARSLGMDVIVTDHHECPAKLPDAVAVVNPKRAGSRYPFSDLAGVGVVFKLITALEYRRHKGIAEAGCDGAAGEPCPADCSAASNVRPAGETASDGDRSANPAGTNETDWLRNLCEKYIDLAALGTVADVMPLVDENRLIVTLGLRAIENTKRPGLAALLELSGVVPPAGMRGTHHKRKRITSSLIGYVIAPRINAAGRLSCASKAVDLFLTDSPDEARQIAAELCDTNRERQNEENSIIEETYKKIEQEHDFERDRVIVLAEDGWHHGVIGIVSSRITEHYNLPSVLISFDGADGEGDPAADIGKGSGRSIKGLNLVEALNYCSDLLVKFGGHELAAGLSIERAKLPEFRRRINEYAREHLSDEDLATTVDVDCELRPEEITLRQAQELYLLEPYGIANPVPVFLLRGARILEVCTVGSGRHTKLLLKGMPGEPPITAIYFGITPAALDFYPGDTCDLIFNLSVNDFLGNQTAQLIVRDIDGSEEYKAERQRERRLYEDIKSGQVACLSPDIVPTRDDFASVYLYIKHEVRAGNDILSLHKIRRHFENVRPIDPVKLRFIVDILSETNILGIERIALDERRAGRSQKLVASRGAELYRFQINTPKGKVNLDKSTIYRRLKSRQAK